VISASYPSTYWFNLVSLFPPTYNNRLNGNRPDIMQKLVDMKPTFLRFPGGNYVEGRGRDDIFDWKKTVGPIAQRPTHLSPWNYRSSDGMGLLEFLEWTEDMHAQPVMAVFAGFALSGSYVATGDALKPFVQDALDEIEYATGDASTKWGAQRIADGRQEPFVVNFVEIGNEDNLGGAAPTYNERFTAFYDAIHAKYPAIKIIATTAVKSRVPYAIDDHHYWNSAAEAQAAAHLYDPTGRLGKRDGPRLFIGEWADRYYTAPAGRGRGGRGARGATGPASGPAALPVAPPVARGPAPVQPPTTNLGCGLADAAFMTGFERNADLVEMSCYAPLFVNVNPGGMQWASDLIGYDALNSFGSPSYYTQKMFSEYLGDVVPPSFMDDVPKNAAGAEQVFYCVTRDSKNGAVDLKVVNVSGSPQSVQIDLHGVASVDSDATSCVLSGSSVNDTNTITDREKVVPVTSKISGVSANFTHEFPAYSVTVLQLQTH
jgi:alpha-N-arabinofuranosidase